MRSRACVFQILIGLGGWSGPGAWLSLPGTSVSRDMQTSWYRGAKDWQQCWRQAVQLKRWVGH